MLKMSREDFPQEQEQRSPNKLKRAITLGAIAVAFVSAGSAVYNKLTDKSGDITTYGPVIDDGEKINNELVILDWNMHNETSQKYGELKEIIDTENVDVALLQEVNKQDARGLSRYFPGMQVKFVMADATTELFDGGYGNVVMSDQEQKDSEALSIKGNSLPDAAARTPASFVADLTSGFSNGLKETGDATQEDRSVLFSTLEVEQDEGKANIRIGTAHVAANVEVHNKQFNELHKFVTDQLKDGGVFCADFNSPYSQVLNAYRSYGFFVPKVGETTLDGKTIDFCAYKPGEVLNQGDVEVLDDYATDHHPVLARFTTQLGD